MTSVAKVALLSLSVPRALSYVVPEALVDRVHQGALVIVPVQTRLVPGVVVALEAEERPSHALKAIHAVVEPQALHPHQLDLARWIAAEYHAPLGRCCALMIPPGLTPRTTWSYALAEDAPPIAEDASLEARILRVLRARGPLTEAQLARHLRALAGWQQALRRLIQRRLVVRTATTQPPAGSTRRTTLVQLALGDATLDLVLERLSADTRLRAATRARRAAALRYLRTQGGMAWADWLIAETGLTRGDLAWLVEKNYVVLGDAERWRDPLADVDYVPRAAPALTPDQHRAWETIAAALEAGAQANFLLRGVTGSGKTELYLRAAEACVRRGKSAIVLVPEISLTPQTARRFLERFPGQVALIHSRLKPGERFDTWRRIRAGQLPIVVGARSALFAPLANLGLIVIDEEHDSAYKHSAAPFYDARRVALHYATLTSATVIFGSATPSLEAWHWARQGRLQLIELPNRVRAHAQRLAGQAARLGVQPAAQPEGGAVCYQPLPEVHVVDMREELRSGNLSPFSRALAEALRETLHRDEQAILFLNRRGEASAVLCRDCGYAARCPNDDVPFTVHLEHGGDARLLRCHHCNATAPLPTRCPACGSTRFRFIGMGTQRLEQLVLEHFPNARPVRWDRDTMGKYGADFLLQRFVRRQANVLIGTQMIAKGLDLPLVTLVGVVLADVGLFLPDFRAAERVFSLIEQVAGRAGRSLLPGRVIVQTYNPQHPAIAFARAHDVQGFARYELAQRHALNLPPFVRLVRFECADKAAARAQQRCVQLARQLRALLPPEAIIGPAPAYFMRQHGRYRWQVMARTSSPRILLEQLALPQGCVADVDPLNLL
ncbi:MAG: primosomal protein N' [Thermoflexales bacterium]|nr:primosomal protein N' [Thermoflexales bacterium]